jgi:K+ transporter
MRYATTLDWVLLILALIFGSLNGIIWPFVLVVNLKLVGSLLDAQAEYETGQIDMDKFTNGMTEACLWYFVIACAIFVAGFIGVCFYRKYEFSVLRCF